MLGVSESNEYFRRKKALGTCSMHSGSSSRDRPTRRQGKRKAEMSAPAKILFVDDEESIRLTFPAVLQAHGFQVTTASTVAEALALIVQYKFDVLIADLNINGIGDGFTVVSAMHSAQPTALRLILTGYPAFENALEAIRHQVHDYLIKPTDTEV